MHHIYNANNKLVSKLTKGASIETVDQHDLGNLPNTYLLCYLNGFEEAKEKLIAAKPFLKLHSDKTYDAFKEVMRIFRKIRYN
jgi:hypothetical protein